MVFSAPLDAQLFAGLTDALRPNAIPLVMRPQGQLQRPSRRSLPV